MDELEALVAQVPDEILDYIEDLEERVEKAEAAMQPADEEDDPIAKALGSLDPEVAELFKAQQSRLDEAEKTLEAERVAKADQEWISKASGLDSIIDDPEAFGRDLRQVAETNSELADRIATALSAANAQVSKSALYKELGHGTPSLGDVGDLVAD